MSFVNIDTILGLIDNTIGRAYILLKRERQLILPPFTICISTLCDSQLLTGWDKS